MSVTIRELIYDPQKGHDVAHPTEITYDPKSFTTKEDAAKALGKALVEYAIKHQGFTRELAESEISVWGPKRTEQYSGSKEWCVVWESGPYDWAVSLSFEIRGPWGYCEPYYGFDLHFTE